MKNGLWTKIVIVIITLEILVGGIYYGYKKINIDDYLGTNTIFKVEDCILLSDSIVEPYNDD